MNPFNLSTNQYIGLRMFYNIKNIFNKKQTGNISRIKNSKHERH